jgi:hypothetical protein
LSERVGGGVGGGGDVVERIRGKVCERGHET